MTPDQFVSYIEGILAFNQPIGTDVRERIAKKIEEVRRPPRQLGPIVGLRAADLVSGTITADKISGGAIKVGSLSDISVSHGTLRTSGQISEDARKFGR